MGTGWSGHYGGYGPARPWAAALTSGGSEMIRSSTLAARRPGAGRARARRLRPALQEREGRSPRGLLRGRLDRAGRRRRRRRRSHGARGPAAQVRACGLHPRGIAGRRRRRTGARRFGGLGRRKLCLGRRKGLRQGERPSRQVHASARLSSRPPRRLRQGQAQAPVRRRLRPKGGYRHGRQAHYGYLDEPMGPWSYDDRYPGPSERYAQSYASSHGTSWARGYKERYEWSPSMGPAIRAQELGPARRRLRRPPRLQAGACQRRPSRLQEGHVYRPATHRYVERHVYRPGPAACPPGAWMGRDGRCIFRPIAYNEVRLSDGFFADSGGVGPAFIDSGGGGGGVVVVGGLGRAALMPRPSPRPGPARTSASAAAAATRAATAKAVTGAAASSAQRWVAISAAIACAAWRGSVAAVIGRPTTRWLAPSASACGGRRRAGLIVHRRARGAHAGRHHQEVRPADPPRQRRLPRAGDHARAAGVDRLAHAPLDQRLGASRA